MERAQIIVAGAGPVGAVTAYTLAERGYEVILCEAGADCARDLRASTFHAPTLEILDQLGVAEDIIAQGLKAPVFHWRERRTGEVIDFDMSEIADATSHPYRIQCEQFYLSRLLADRLTNHPKADMRFNHRLIGFEQDDSGVTAAIETPFEVKQIRADYLISAEGGNSITRKWLNVGFEGFTYPEKFLCLSTKAPLEEHLENLSLVNYVSDPEEWLVLLRVPRLWRVLVPCTDNDDEKWLVSDEKKEKVFDRLIGAPDVETEHRTIYRVHQRVAEKFNHGRVFLIGDAAHLNNPLGGFGMNSGIHDAWNLVDKLEKVIRGEGGPELFELFDRQRRTITHGFVQAQTKQNMEFMKASESQRHHELMARMEHIHADPARRRQYLLTQSMLQSRIDEKHIQ